MSDEPYKALGEDVEHQYSRERRTTREALQIAIGTIFFFAIGMFIVWIATLMFEAGLFLGDADSPCPETPVFRA